MTESQIRPKGPGSNKIHDWLIQDISWIWYCWQDDLCCRLLRSELQNAYKTGRPSSSWQCNPSTSVLKISQSPFWLPAKIFFRSSQICSVWNLDFLVLFKIIEQLCAKLCCAPFLGEFFFSSIVSKFWHVSYMYRKTLPCIPPPPRPTGLQNYAKWKVYSFKDGPNPHSNPNPKG